MAVNLDESHFFKFVIISEKPKLSKIIEKPSKDKDSMSTNSTNSSPAPPTPPTLPNNEKLEEEKQNSQVTNKQTASEVKLSDTPNSNVESTKKESSQLTIEVPPKSTSPLVTSPRELTGAKIPEPTITPTPQNSNNIFKSVSKKIGNIMKTSSDSDTVTEDVATSDSKMQQERQNTDDNVANNVANSIANNVANNDVTNNVNTENVANAVNDENQKEEEGEDKKITPETNAAKKKTGSMGSFKFFITRTSSTLVEKIQEKFDNLDRHIYPDIDPHHEENQDKLSREAGISEREQLLENKDVEIKNDKSQKSQTAQSTQSALAEVGLALNERQEKLNSIGEKTEKLNDSAMSFLELATQINREQKQKSSKPWKFW